VAANADWRAVTVSVAGFDLNSLQKVDADCQILSGMPVCSRTDDLKTNFVVGRDFRRPAHWLACSPSLHGLTGHTERWPKPENDPYTPEIQRTFLTCFNHINSASFVKKKYSII